ncbi:hypothetical protein [Celeribacter sp. ULVN23_4]
MEKLLQAISDKHPGCELRDFRLLANLVEANDQNGKDIDGEFATAIVNAEEKTFGEI